MCKGSKALGINTLTENPYPWRVSNTKIGGFMNEPQKKTTLDHSIAFRVAESDFHQLVVDANEKNQKPNEYARQWLLIRRETLAKVSNLESQIKMLLAGKTETERRSGVYRRAAFGAVALLLLLSLVTLARLIPDPARRNNEAVIQQEGVQP